MTENEFYKYWKPARTAVYDSTPGRSDSIYASEKIAASFGLPYPHGSYWPKINLNESHIRALQLLATADKAHLPTILAMIKVRYAKCPENESNPATSSLENS